ncbi:MAG: recombinase family protein [Chloroflexota bacterium]
MVQSIRAALYERVSTDAQAERYGLEAQHWGLKERAQERRYSLILDGDKDAFVDDGYSGGDLNRPALSRLRQAVREGKVEVLLCYDPDRLSRNLSDLLLLTDEAERAGVRLEFITQETDASPEGRMFFAMRGAVAEYERAKIRERTIRGRLQKARQGKMISRAAAPYGYRYDPKASALVVQEEEAKVVRLAFHLCTQEHLSLVQLADRLNRLGIARPQGGLRWHQSHLGRMLRNETYAGTLCQNRWQGQKVMGKPGAKPEVRVTQRPKDKQIPVAVPAIVPREVFDMAQKRLEENGRLARRNAKRDYLLSGPVKHACGSGMGGRTHSGVTYYHCYKDQKFKAPINERGELQPCRCKWANGRAMETAVWDTVTGLLRHPDLLMQELERLTQPDSATREALEDELAQVRKRLEELPKEEQRLVEGYRKGLYADFMMREEMERVQKEQASAEERRRELERQLARLDKTLGYRGQIEELARQLSQGLDAMDFAQRRALLRLLVDEVVYDDAEGKVTIRTIIPVDERRLRPIHQWLCGARPAHPC